MAGMQILQEQKSAALPWTTLKIAPAFSGYRPSMGIKKGAETQRRPQLSLCSCTLLCILFLLSYCYHDFSSKIIY